MNMYQDCDECDFHECIEECSQCMELEERFVLASGWLLEFLRKPDDIALLQELCHCLGTSNDDRIMMEWMVENNKYLKNLSNERTG